MPSAEVEYMGDPAVITAKSVFNVRAGPAETVWIAAERRSRWQAGKHSAALETAVKQKALWEPGIAIRGYERGVSVEKIQLWRRNLTSERKPVESQ